MMWSIVAMIMLQVLPRLARRLYKLTCRHVCMHAPAQDRKAAIASPPAATSDLMAQVEKIIVELPGEGVEHLQAMTCTCNASACWFIIDQSMQSGTEETSQGSEARRT